MAYKVSPGAFHSQKPVVPKTTSTEGKFQDAAIISAIVSGIILLVFSALTMTGVVTPLVGGSVILAVAAVSGVFETLTAAKGYGKRSTFPIILKIVTTSVYVTISALAITNIIAVHTLGLTLIPTLLLGSGLMGGSSAFFCFPPHRKRVKNIFT